MRFSPVGEGRCELGEGPTWDALTARLWWVDITPGRVWSVSGDSRDPSRLEHEFDQPVGLVALRAGGGFVAGLRDGVALVSAEGEQSWLAADGVGDAPAGFLAGERFNDGKCDAAGRLWAGSTNVDFGSAPGTLYRIEPDGSVMAALEQVEFANGLGWSPDGGTFYLINSLAYALLAFDFDVAAGTLGERRTLVEFDKELGMPDGMTVDAEGGIWVARYGAAAVEHYSAAGVLEARFPVAATQPTSIAFGGAGLDELWVTTAAQYLDDAELSREPLNGALLRTVAAVRGTAATRFAG